MATKQFSIFGSAGLDPRNFVQVLLERAVERVNSGVSMTLTARKDSERPPQDTRHLTDTRTRVSTLLEYSVAYEMNHVLNEQSHGHSISTVLWNVFPDLIVRDEKRNNVLGLEVKALHTAAEEKSANFDAPIQIVRKDSDFIVILIWGWQTSSVNGTNITYPHIHKVGVFDAWLLAKIRDYGWLFNQAGRIKGIDLCSAIINGNDASFKAEEGNMGKLMRIAMPATLPTSVPSYAEMKIEDQRYAEFLQNVLALGLRETFLDVCSNDGAEVRQLEAPHSYPTECKVLGTATRRSAGNSTLKLMAGGRPVHWLESSSAVDFPEGTIVLWLSQKLNWKVLAKKNRVWIETGSGAKPDTEVEAIQRALDSV